MAKRTTKSPAADQSGLPTSSFQIPENLAVPSPFLEVAATVPRLPEGGQVSAGRPAQQKLKPPMPTGKADYDPEAVQRTKATLDFPLLTMTRPVNSRLNTLATELLGRCAMANELGLREATHALVTFSDDRQWLFLMPTVKHSKAVEINYHKKQAHLNLWKPFEESGKMVEKGYKEIYALEMTEEPITIHGVSGFALYIYLVEPKKESIQPRPEGTSRRPSKKENAKTSASTTAKVPSTNAGSTTASPAEESEQLQKLRKELTERDEKLDARDAEIDELMAQLQAYRERFGSL